MDSHSRSGFFTTDWIQILFFIFIKCSSILHSLIHKWIKSCRAFSCQKWIHLESSDVNPNPINPVIHLSMPSRRRGFEYSQIFLKSRVGSFTVGSKYRCGLCSIENSLFLYPPFSHELPSIPHFYFRRTVWAGWAPVYQSFLPWFNQLNWTMYQDRHMKHIEGPFWESCRIYKGVPAIVKSQIDSLKIRKCINICTIMNIQIDEPNS